MATEPNPTVDTDNYVTLDGKKWPVPKLAPRQNRKVVPAILRCAKIDQRNITEEQVDDLYLVLYTGLTRAHPTLTRDEFDGMPISVEDALAAFPIVAIASGFYRAPLVSDPLELKTLDSSSQTGDI